MSDPYQQTNCKPGQWETLVPVEITYWMTCGCWAEGWLCPEQRPICFKHPDALWVEPVKESNDVG